MAQPIYTVHQAPSSNLVWGPVAINDNGVVLGESVFPDGTHGIVIWDGGPTSVLPYPDCQPFAVTNAFPIDEGAKIVGAMPSTGLSKAFLHTSTPPKMIDLSQKVGVGVPDYAVAINDSGLIAGNNGFPMLDSPFDVTRVFLYDSVGDTLEAVLEPPEGYVGIKAWGVNDSGHLVGNLVSLTSSSMPQQHVFLCRDAATIENVGEGEAIAVNKADVITGRRLFDNRMRAFRLNAADGSSGYEELKPQD